MITKDLMANLIQEILDLDDIREKVIMGNQMVDIEIKKMVLDTEIRNIENHQIRNMGKVIKYI